ncbi:MAG: agmatinase [Erysipelotrichaceae bacterium]|nr:agmatinase [Erysipelotrichaceae bacterium]
MKTTELMKLDPDLWGGLNQPDLTVDQADAVVFGIAWDGSVSFRAGAKEAPQALRSITYTVAPTTECLESLEKLKIVDLGDFEGEDRETVFNDVETAVSELVRQNCFFTMIGGDHSTTIPVLKGIDKAIRQPFGIIHIDAHFDLCEALSGDTLSHGCTERRALEMAHISGPENLFFIGIRSVEPQELEFIKENPVQYVTARDYSRMGTAAVVEKAKAAMAHLEAVYVTVDIDSLDPAYAPGTGTPQFGGLTARELLDLLEGLFELPVIGFDVVEVAPALDASWTSVFAARKIIMECWGHVLRKGTQK